MCRTASPPAPRRSLYYGACRAWWWLARSRVSQAEAALTRARTYQLTWTHASEDIARCWLLAASEESEIHCHVCVSEKAEV
ncbi:hypothetical protein EJB05_06945, partial [Eragrostis curvula]